MLKFDFIYGLELCDGGGNFGAKAKTEAPKFKRNYVKVYVQEPWSVSIFASKILEQ